MNCFKLLLPASILALFWACSGDFKEITDEERQAGLPQLSSSSSFGALSSSSSEVGVSSSALKQCEGTWNANNKFCYDGNLYDTCDGVSYDPSALICTDGVAIPARCNNVNYNPLTQGCCNNANIFEKATQFCSSNSIEDIALACNLEQTSGAAGSGITPPTLSCNNDKLAVVSNWENAPNWSSPSLGEYDISVNATCGTETVLTGFCGTFKTLCADFNPNADTTHYGNLKKRFCDERDGKKYVYVEIGDQTWMAENLNYDVPGNATDVCYNNNDNNCETYGRLYDWATAMGNSASSTENPSGVQGICPEGWHLPSDAEWDALTDYVDSQGSCTSCAGTKLKATSYWTGIPIMEGTDDFGFSALLGGYGGMDDIFSSVVLNGYWWSASENDDLNAKIRSMEYNAEAVYKNNYGKSHLYSVRCLQYQLSEP